MRKDDSQALNFITKLTGHNNRSSQHETHGTWHQAGRQSLQKKWHDPEARAAEHSTDIRWPSCMSFPPTPYEIGQIPHTLFLQSLPSQIGRPDPPLPSRMMMQLLPTRLLSHLLLSSILATLLASPVPDNSLSRLTNSKFGLDSIDLTPAPGLPSLESIPGISINDLLNPPRGLSTRNYDDRHAAASPSRNPILPRQQACIPAEFPLTYGPELSSYMWELTAVRVAYNYLRLLGQTVCTVPPEGGVFVEGWVNGYYVRVLGVSKWGSQDAGGRTVASHCEDVAFGMEGFLVSNGEGCIYPFGDYEITGGASTAWGNGDLWVST